MILVTVGTTPFNFNRLLKTMNELVSEGKIREKVVMQIGNSSYRPKKTKWFKSVSYSEMENLNKKARIVITHGGAGSILTALKYEKPVIAVPRLKSYDEHSDDHQLDLVKALADAGKVVGVFDMNDLYSAIVKAKYTRVKSTKERLSKEVSSFLRKCEKNG